MIHHKTLIVGAIAASCLVFVGPSNLASQQPTSILERADQELSKAQQDKLVNTIYEYAKSCKTAKEYSNLVELCQSALTKPLSKDNQAYAHSVLGWSLQRRGDKRMELSSDLRTAGNQEQATQILKKSIEDFTGAIEADKSRWQAKLARGIANVNLGEFDSALSDFTDVTKSNPKNANGWFNRAEVNYGLAQFESAISDYDHVLELNAGDIQAMTGRAHCYARLGEWDKARADYDVVVKMQPNSMMALVNRGDMYQMKGDWELAYQDFQSATKFANSGVAFQKTAWLLATCPDQRFNRPGESLDMITKAVSLDGRNPVNLETLAAAYAALGQFDKAKASQAKAMQQLESKSGDMKVRMSMYESGKPFQQSTDTKIR